MKKIKKFLAVFAILFFHCSISLACPLCKATVESSVESQSLSQGLNLAIIVLLIPPVIVFGAIFFVAYKSDKEVEY